MKNKQLVQEREYDFPYHYIPQFQNGFSQNISWDWSKNYLSAIEFILTQIEQDQSKIKRIVDVGCGDGRITREIHDKFKEIIVSGVDYSERAIKIAKAMNPDIEFQSKNIIEDDIDSKADAITLIEVFEHIPINMCKEFALGCSKILNKSGLLYITVPHKNVPLSDKHEQHFDESSLYSYFGDYFSVDKIIYIQKSTLLLKILNKLIYNRMYILTNTFINDIFYKFYKNNCFLADKSNCERIYLKLKKK